MKSVQIWLQSRAKRSFTAHRTSDRNGMYPHKLIPEPAAKHTGVIRKLGDSRLQNMSVAFVILSTKHDTLRCRIPALKPAPRRPSNQPIISQATQNIFQRRIKISKDICGNAHRTCFKTLAVQHYCTSTTCYSAQLPLGLPKHFVSA